MKKQHGGNEAVYTNSAEAGVRTEAPHYSLYANPYFVMHDGERYTEHIYIGSERVAVHVAKLGANSSYIGNFENESHAGNGISPSGFSYSQLRQAQEGAIAACYDSLGYSYSPMNHRDAKDIVMVPTGFDENNQQRYVYPDIEEERDYYYCTDHLGSSRLVLDSNGQIAEKLMFLPTGEVFKDERNSSYYHSDFLFSGKELDAETGNYYYGARYYAPRIGIWLSPDPLQLKYPGVSSYAYCMGNPVRLIDPFGLAPGDFFKTMNAAAINFGLFFNDNSIREGREYGSSIYVVYNRNAEKGYSYSIPNVGKKDAVTVSNPPMGYLPIADIHTHGRYQDDYHNKEFSGLRDPHDRLFDINYKRNINGPHNIGNSNNSKIVSYLVTPNGSLQKYDPATNKITIK